MTKLKHRISDKTLPEIFTEVKNTKSFDEKVDTIRAYDNKAMRFYVNAAYGYDWKQLNLQIPEYKPSHLPVGITYSNIGKSINQIETMLKVAKTKPERARAIMQDILESVSAQEAELLTQLFLGRKTKDVPKKVFEAVYPNVVKDAKPELFPED